MTTKEITPSDMAQALRDKELVTTHVHHIVKEECAGENLRTLCNYHLYAYQYKHRTPFTDSDVTVTHLCHHCTNVLKNQLNQQTE